MRYCAREQWLALALGALILLMGAARLGDPGAGTLGPRAHAPAASPAGVRRDLASTPAAPLKPAAGPLVDVNRAGAAELETVPGIGPVLARRILELRAQRGRFQSLAELKQVRGIKERRLARLAPYLTLGQGGSG